MRYDCRKWKKIESPDRKSWDLCETRKDLDNFSGSRKGTCRNEVTDQLENRNRSKQNAVQVWNYFNRL